jgi:quinol-cytochrome oxidoreductase complex cytochrome b subunit
MTNLLLHFRPRRVQKEALRFSLTWGLGGMAALMIIQQLLSGLLLGLFYEPVPVFAYESVSHIQDTLFLGKLLRNLHHWTGHALIVVVFLHLLRVLIGGALYSPRHWNWLVGLLLGGLVLISNFSGYLLPWDQLAYWAVTIAISMLSYIPLAGESLQDIIRGGEEVGGATLHLFYIIHTTLVPVAILLCMSFHFWFVRKAGGVFLPRRQKEGDSEANKPHFVPFIPELLVREIAFATLVTSVLLLFSMFVDAPLGRMANPALTPANVQAPWYFMGAQELLLHVPPFIAVFILPLALIFILLLLPFVRFRVFSILLYTSITMYVGLTVVGIWFRGPGMQWVWPW